jgi:hypothetical protein
MNPLLIRWLVVALVIVAASVAGYFHGVEHEQGKQAKRERAADIEFTKRLTERVERERQEQAMVAASLEAERAARAKDAESFNRRLANAPRGKIIECPGAKKATPAEATAASTVPEPVDPRLSALGNELWNRSLAAGTTAAERAGWLASANAAPGPVEIDDALRNLRENATLLGQCREREQETRAWLKREGLSK